MKAQNNIVLLIFLSFNFSFAKNLSSYDFNLKGTHSVWTSRGTFQQNVFHVLSVTLKAKEDSSLFSDISLTGGYSHPWSERFKTRTLTPENYGFEDVLLNVNRSFYENTTGFLNLVLPLSQVSRTQSLQTALALGISYQTEVKKVQIDFSNYGQWFLYRYHSVGEFANPFISSNHSLSAFYSLTYLTLKSSANFLIYYDLDSNFYSYPQLEIQLSHLRKMFGENFEVFISYFWNKDPRSVYLNLTQFFAPTNGFRFGFSWEFS